MLFLDFQYYYVDKELVIKELATLSKHVVSHYVFTPPCEFTKLSDKDMKQFLWLSKNYHKFLFYSGDVPYQRLTQILETMRYERMFVKGLEKYLYLKNLGYKVYLLDEKMESLKKKRRNNSL